MPANDRVAGRFIVHGRVQGVGFRYSALSRARSLGVVGYVRNRADGSVEVWAEGSRTAVDDFAGWLDRGPPMARVSRVDRENYSPKGIYKQFSITY